MSSRVLRQISALAVAAAVAGLMASTVAGQSSLPPKPKPSAVPRTPDGKPDLQGNWTNNSVTPLQRPDAWKNKTTLTDAELEQLKKLVAEVTEEGGDAQFGDQIVENALAGVKNPDSSDSGTGNYNHFWLVERTVKDRRTALLTDPADCRLPALTKEASDRQAAATQARRGRRLDNPEERGVGERCVNFGVPKLGAGYNSYYQIVQTPTHVVFMSEMAHDARIIPLDKRPFPDTMLPRGRPGATRSSAPSRLRRSCLRGSRTPGPAARHRWRSPRPGWYWHRDRGERRPLRHY